MVIVSENIFVAFLVAIACIQIADFSSLLLNRIVNLNSTVLVKIIEKVNLKGLLTIYASQFNLFKCIIIFQNKIVIIRNINHVFFSTEMISTNIFKLVFIHPDDCLDKLCENHVIFIVVKM